MWPKCVSKSDIEGVIAILMGHAPDDLASLSFHPDDPGPTLEEMFLCLTEGVNHVFRAPRYDDVRPRMLHLAGESYRLYSAGDSDGGFLAIDKLHGVIYRTS